MKAFAYLRVSGQDQVSGDGFARQLIAIEQFAASQGLQLAKVYREEGVTGTAESRPTLAELMEDASPGDTVIVEKLDRLARDLLVQEAIFSKLMQAGIRLLSATEPDMSQNDPTRKFIRRILGAVAELDKDLIVARLRGARQRVKTATGRCEGRKPYGHRPGEAEVVARIRGWRTAGVSCIEIARRLNASGTAARGGGQWFETTVRRIAGRETCR
jgi:DNA invertase Pin-like site-specific DNA recombinase